MVFNSSSHFTIISNIKSMKCVNCFKRAIVIKDGNTYCKKCIPADIDIASQWEITTTDPTYTTTNTEIPTEDLQAFLGINNETK